MLLGTGHGWAVWLSRDFYRPDELAERQRTYWRIEDERKALVARLGQP